MGSARERAELVMARCEVLAAFSEEPDQLTRGYGTSALRDAQAAVADWMEAAGLMVRRDTVGNLIGRREGEPGGKTMLLGGHLDTVRDAGKYDGTLGVLTGTAAVERLTRRGQPLPFAIEVIGFADEEGLRFQTTYLGSRALAGTLDEATLATTDANGVTLAEAIRAFGGRPELLAGDTRRPEELLGWCEVHIEQGPVLEAGNAPVGIVSAITSGTRAAVTFDGVAGHAGTVPMAVRRDALAAAAEFILVVERTAGAVEGLVGTVGQITAAPGASNVISGHVRLSLDVRHADDAIRNDACQRLRERALAIGSARDVQVTWQSIQETGRMRCNPALTELLAQAVADTGHEPLHLPSGAGHDAVVLAGLTPVTMLFVRCAGGISHHPAEAVTGEDVAVAVEVLDRFLELVAADE